MQPGQNDAYSVHIFGARRGGGKTRDPRRTGIQIRRVVDLLSMLRHVLWGITVVQVLNTTAAATNILSMSNVNLSASTSELRHGLQLPFED